MQKMFPGSTSEMFKKTQHNYLNILKKKTKLFISSHLSINYNSKAFKCITDYTN